MSKLIISSHDQIDWIMDNICSKCSRHSISPEAKKQCSYLAILCSGDNDHTFNEDCECSKFKEKKKYKRNKFKQQETLF